MSVRRLLASSAAVAVMAACATSAVLAQEQGGTQAADPQLPDVEVIQQQQPPPPAPAAAAPKPKPAAAAAKPKPKPQPVAQQSEPDFPEPVEFESAPSETLSNSPYGSPAASGAAARATQSATTPSGGSQIVPENLDGFSAAATNLKPDVLQANQPRNVNEALTRVPGVIVINDDGNAHHGGIAVRGSPARRSRKMLVMEDGHANNLALWLDPSVHYWGPIDRFESIEVIRGTVITHGPNNNFGVINARNLSPFGPDETVVSASIGFTRNKAGSFTEFEGDGDGSTPTPVGPTVFGNSDTDVSLKWHTHTRQSVDNVGLVLSYTGANVQGAWDTERLRTNDFYGAIGWKGTSSDLVVSSSYARQRDSYDEQNFLGNYELGDFTPGDEDGDGDIDEDDAAELAEDTAANFAGLAEQQFYNLKHCKTCYAPGSVLNTYAGDIWRGQIVHNAYIDQDTTVTSRIYAQHHTRNRYQTISPGAFPDGTPGVGPDIEIDPDPTDEDGIEDSAVIFGDNTMFGRLRTFRHVGGEVRTEWANRVIGGFKQDLQAGVRYEYQDMTNRNFLGRDNEILESGDEDGVTIFDRELSSNAVSAFLQTNITVATDFNVIPGIRFEWYGVDRQNRVVAREESEAGGADDCSALDPDGGGPLPPPADCSEIDGIVFNPTTRDESYSNFHALPGIGFAYTGLHKTTVFGGYHRGMSTGVLRNEDFPVDDEIGDNFNLGFRSTALKGLELEAVGFYQLLKDYQFGASFNAAVDRSFGRADEAEISGVELFGRMNSQPFTGGSLNFYSEANYTYSRGIFKDLVVEDDGEFIDLSGNRLPEVPLHVAALTLGVEQTKGWRWDLSATWAYRGAFFTDEGNTRFGLGGELECEDEGGGEFECEIEEAGEDGEVPGIWLLSARFNMDIGNTGASVFVAGDNLLDEFYISDREDGMKPGTGRTLWTGFKYKF